MPVNPIAENVLGTIGTVCWTFQILPQIWKSWRSKSTEGLSSAFIMMWCIADLVFGVYVILQHLSIPLIIQPQLFVFFSAIAWAQCLHYSRRISTMKCIGILAVVLSVSGGIEVGLVYAFQAARNSGHEKAVDVLGVIPSVMNLAGLVPQYIKIWKLKEVVGISRLFIFTDGFGACCCFLGLLFRGKIDAFAAATYLSLGVADAGILVCAAVLNPLARRRRARESGAPIPNNQQVQQDAESRRSLESHETRREDLEAQRGEKYDDEKLGDSQGGTSPRESEPDVVELPGLEKR